MRFFHARDIVILERSCGSNESHQLFLNLIPYSPPVVLPASKYNYIPSLKWFAKRRCKIETLSAFIPGDNPCLHVKNLQVHILDLILDVYITMENCKALFEHSLVSNLDKITIRQNQNREVMEQLSACTGHVKRLRVTSSQNCIEWLTVDILTRWKLKEISLSGFTLTTNFVLLIVQN